MGFQIELDSNIDFDASYDAVGHSEYVRKPRLSEKGGFGFALKDVEHVTYVVQGTGRVQIFTDDWSDPAILIDIARCLLVSDQGKPVELKLAKCNPNSGFKEDFWRVFRRRQTGIQPRSKWEDFDYLVDWENRYRIRVYEACEHLKDEGYWSKVYKGHKWPMPEHLKPVEAAVEEMRKQLAPTGLSIHSDRKSCGLSLNQG